MSERRWVAVLAPDLAWARQDLLRCAEMALTRGLNPQMSMEHMILDTAAVRFQWVLPDHVQAVHGAHFDEWALAEGYQAGPESWRMVKLLQHSVAGKKLAPK